MLGPPAKREAVWVARAEGKLSEGRACGLIERDRASWRYGRQEQMRSWLSGSQFVARALVAGRFGVEFRRR